MMITEKTWKVPVAVWLGIVAMASCILPQGRVYAQDFEAVERRLGGAVEAGELTLEQASIMMKALKRSAGSKRAHNREMEAKKRRYMAFAKEIEAAVEAGKISKEDAEKELIAVRKKMFRDAGRKQKDREMEAKKRRYMAFAKEIEAAVEAGKISKEDAEKELIAVRKKMFRDAGRKQKDREMEAKKRRYMAFAKEIEAAVEAGKISKEDAEEKLIAVRKKMFRDAGRKQEDRSDKHGISVEEYRRAEAKIRELVKKGEVSKEDAEKRLIEMRKSIRTEKSEGNDKRS